MALRDTRVIGELAAFFANCGKLPADMGGFVDFMESRLRAIEERLGGDFDLSPVWPVLGRLREAVMDLEASMEGQENTDDAILETAGELARITYTASSPYHQDPVVKAPVFSGLAMAEGLTRENTEEEYYLAVQTRFVRQRNRLTGQMKQAVSYTHLVLTGRSPSERILGAADYVSEIQKVRHPYDRGILARKGIEY